MFIRKDSADKPHVIMLVGLAGSGKSTVAQSIQIVNSETGEITKPHICSSDEMREKMFGDQNVQEDTNGVFEALHKEAREMLLSGKDVIIDSTNLNKKKRAAFLQTLSKISCVKECICVMTPFDRCVIQNSARDRVVPYADMKKMYMNWTPPCIEEGFDKVSTVYNVSNDELHNYLLSDLFGRLDNFDQDNHHHILTLGEHCKQAASYVLSKYPEDELLLTATILHDIGKEFTKTYQKADGTDSHEAHYYQHHCVGAYDSMFYTLNMGLSDYDKLHVANTIYFHMHPYIQWTESAKSLKRDMSRMSESVYDHICKLHDADVSAHSPEKVTIDQRLDDFVNAKGLCFDFEREDIS